MTCVAVLFCAAVGCKKETGLKAADPAVAAAAPSARVAAAPAAPTLAQPIDNRIELAITDAGFVPARIAAKAGVPLTMVITRKTDHTCAKEILFAGQEGETDLPLDKAVTVSYTPKAAGEVRFGCAMGMMVGGVLAIAP